MQYGDNANAGFLVLMGPCVAAGADGWLIRSKTSTTPSQSSRPREVPFTGIDSTQTESQPYLSSIASWSAEIDVPGIIRCRQYPLPEDF